MGGRPVDLDPRDQADRLAIAAELVRIREQEARIGQRALAARLGVDQPGIGRYERGDQWRIRTVRRWARALGRTFTLTPAGFPQPAAFWAKSTDIETALHAVLGGVVLGGDTGDEWAIANLQSELAGIRVACGVSRLRLARRLGITEQAVSLFEGGEHGASVTTAQRYTRAIARCAGRPDAHLALSLEVPVLEEPAVV